MQAFDMIKIERNNKKLSVLTIFLLLLSVLFTGSIKLSHAEEKISKSVSIRTIVIDPGHGAMIMGARGLTAALKKGWH
jgi:N-acetylmuramoyl-L-alanine amidase